MLVWGAMAATAFIGLGGLAIVETGAFDTAATTPHSALVAWATHTTMIRSVKIRSAAYIAPPLAPQDIQTGLGLYETNCVMCHGGPG